MTPWTDAPSTGRFEGRVHRLPVRIYYEDTDFSGVVYHGNYLRYFERGRSDFLRSIGVTHQELLQGEAATAFSVVRAEIDYERAARIDDALVVETVFEALRGPRFIIRQRLSRDGETIAQARLQACCISLTGRAKKPPAVLVERLKPFLDPIGPQE